MDSIFTRIIKGEIPSYKIAEDEYFYAFLDVFPLVEGHVLVVPKMQVDKFFDVGDDLLGRWLIFAKPIAKAIEQAFDCDRCAISVIGLEVPHAHMHMVPLNGPEDLNFTRPKLSMTKDDLKGVQEKILRYL